MYRHDAGHAASFVHGVNIARSRQFRRPPIQSQNRAALLAPYIVVVLFMIAAFPILRTIHPQRAG
jgi:hypothetical protein